MDEESNLDFNFWPSFADIMLSLVLLIILLFSVNAVLSVGKFDTSDIEDRQWEITKNIAKAYNVPEKDLVPEELKPQVTQYKISSSIIITNEPQLQKITFSDQVLFVKNESTLNKAGEEALTKVGDVIKSHLSSIREIQIQGHTDTDEKPDDTQSKVNLNLGAERALTVFLFLQFTVGIDPTEHLMSATTFGKYKPASREDNASFNKNQLTEANNSVDKKGQNRRIELRLIYKY